MLTINTNNGAITAAKAAKNAQKMMDKAMIRLSTGTRLNSAKDDPGSLSVAIRMSAEINGLTTSLKNAGDAQSAIDTGEAALAEVQTLLLRMRELAVQAATQTTTTADRAALDSEVSALETEINRIGTSTTWGGINILNGTYSKASPIKFQIGPNNGDTLSFTMGYVAVSTAALAAQGGLGLAASNVTSIENASSYISGVDKAISIVSAKRASFGAISNRLDSTITNLRNMRANITSARGQIVDTDYAVETADLAKAQILLQAATAMLSQANASKNLTMQLINN